MGPPKEMSSNTSPKLPTLVELPPPETKFEGLEKLAQTINITKGDFLIVKGVSFTKFQAIDAHRRQTERGKKFRLRRYHRSSKIMIVTIPTETHEDLHLVLYREIFVDIGRQGIQELWKDLGNTTFRAKGHPGGDGGEGDSTGRPRHLGPGSWPTLVIEAGDSEPLSELHNDMRWWFQASDHRVKIVLLAKIIRAQRIVMIERWEEDGMIRPGATTTRAMSLVPVLRQTVTITEDTSTMPASYHVARGDLVLGFRLLFLRAPGPGERDIIIDTNTLQKCGREILSDAV